MLHTSRQLPERNARRLCACPAEGNAPLGLLPLQLALNHMVTAVTLAAYSTSYALY